MILESDNHVNCQTAFYINDAVQHHDFMQIQATTSYVVGQLYGEVLFKIFFSYSMHKL